MGDRGVRVAWPRVGVLAVLLLIVFFVGRATAPEGISEEQLEAARTELEQADDEKAALERELQEVAADAELVPSPTPTPTTTLDPEGRAVYVVQSGDTLAGIAETFCGDADLAEFIATFNEIEDPTQISVGMQIRIPSDCTGTE